MSDKRFSEACETIVTCLFIICATYFLTRLLLTS